MQSIPATRPASRLIRLLTQTRKVHARGNLEAESHVYCRDLVRKHDYDSLLCSYFYPTRETREAFFALKAFNIELATVQESVSQAAIGQMRMQFWRDVVKNISREQPPKHPVALALHESNKRFRFSPYHLKRIIDARDADLFAPTHPTLSSLEAYSESTASTMLYLLLGVLNQTSSEAFNHAASHIGLSASFTTLLRSLPFHASQRRMVIPVEVSAKHGLREEDVYRHGGDARGISDAVYELANTAKSHLDAARDLFTESHGEIPSQALPVFLTAVPAAAYLESLEKVNFDAFHISLRKRDWRLPWRMWRANSRRSPW